jgi:PQQ-like domain
VWGWGGTAYSPGDDALYAVTANAFAGGSNTGDDFSESVGYGEHLVKLAPDLSVEDSDHPSDLATPADLDFVGSPVVFEHAGCGELVVGADKDDELYAWRADDIGNGPLWELQLEPYDYADPFLSQLAWSPGLASLYAVTGTQLLRIGIGADCEPHVDWREPLGTKTENGSPTIADDTVWFAANDSPMLYGYDARTGERVFSAPLGGTTLEAPTIAGGRLVVGTLTGLVEGFAFGTRPDADPPSWATALHVSKTIGIASIVDAPGPCMCSTRQLYTNDRGKTWHETTTISAHFTASAGRVYFWSGGRLSTLVSLPRRTSSTRLASTIVATFTDGTIKDVDPIPGGVAVLVSSRVHGQGWDTAPRVLIVKGTTVDGGATWITG